MREHSIQHLSRLIIFALAWLIPCWLRAEPESPNIFPAGNFASAATTYVPWAGVDSENNIRGLGEKQIDVDDTGTITYSSFGPSVAVGDLTGGGKNDLVLADSKGYFWYYHNTGTPQKYAFTQGEVIPIWLGEERVTIDTEGVDNVAPRIQLLKASKGDCLGIIAGTYAGKLFGVPNTGSTIQPNFAPTTNRDSLLINTRKQGVLWCNFLAPFFTSAFRSDGLVDLVMGEGTYSANSIYFLHNLGAPDQPVFDGDHTQKIVPGMGLEQLTPNVVDWNNDGKADIIAGDRTGHINLFLNNSTDPEKPSFAGAMQVKVGGIENFGSSVTVTVCDLSNNHLPNLLIGRNDGTLNYAENTGTPGNPQFSTPAVPLKGVLPPDYHYVSPLLWHKNGAWGESYELVGCTNPEMEPGFAFPAGETTKYALKFWVWPYKDLYFQRYFLPNENKLTEHVIRCSQKMKFKMNVAYHVHFWALAAASSVANFRFRLVSDDKQSADWAPATLESEIQAGAQWTEVDYSFKISNDPAPNLKEWPFAFEFRFTGQAPFYIDDIQIKEEL